MAAATRDDDPTTWFPIAKTPANGTRTPAAVKAAPANDDDDPATWFPVATGEKKLPAIPSEAPVSTPAFADTIVAPSAVGTMQGQGALGRIGGAIAEGYNTSPSLLEPAGKELVNQIPWVGKNLLTPQADIIGGLLGAAGRGISQAAYETGAAIGGPRLGRDMNMLAQVAPAAGAMPAYASPTSAAALASAPISAEDMLQLRLQRLRDGGAPAEPNLLQGMPPVAPEVAARIDARPAAPATDIVEGRAAAPERPAAPATPAEQPAVAGVEPTRQAGDPSMDEHFTPGSGPSPVRPVAAGADVTVEQIPPKTKAERITDLDKDVAQTVADRSVQTGPGAYRDENVYVEGIPPRIEAHKNLSPQAALDHKTYYNEGSDTRYNADVRDNIDKRNVGMTEMAKAEIGDANSLDALKKERAKVTPDSMGVFAEEKPVDPVQLDGYHAMVDSLIKRFAKDDGVRGILENIRAKLHNAQGEREVLPSVLQQVRDTMTGKLEQTGGTDKAAHNARRARSALTDLVEALNPVMDTGAPKWSQWRQEWARLSQPINAQEFLQQYRQGGPKSLWNPEGLLVPRNVQRMLRDIAADHRLPTGKSLGLTDTQIQKFVNIRNEIMPYNVARELAAVPGSPTTQLLQAAGKKGLGPKTQLAVDLGGQLALGGAQYLAGQYPFLNIPLATWQGSRGYRKSNALAAQAAREAEFNELLKQHLLSPNITRQTPYPNPLEKP